MPPNVSCWWNKNSISPFRKILLKKAGALTGSSKVEADIYAASRLWKQILVSQSYSQLRRTKDSFTRLPRASAQLNKVIQITIGCTWIGHVSFSLSLVIKRKMLRKTKREEDTRPRQVSADLELYRMVNESFIPFISESHRFMSIFCKCDCNDMEKMKYGTFSIWQHYFILTDLQSDFTFYDSEWGCAWLVDLQHR